MKKFYNKPTIAEDSLTTIKPLCNIDYIPVSSLIGGDEEEEETEE